MNIGRKGQLYALVFLSALTATSLYAVQGAATSGEFVFPTWFWPLDVGLWALRAMVESAVIAYLFRTKAETNSQARVLGAIEVVLLALITLTIGPALRALGLGLTMNASMSSVAFTAWNFGVAAYTSLMIGGCAYAYKVQPDDDGDGTAAKLEMQLAQARTEYANLLRSNETTAQEKRALAQLVANLEEALPIWQGLPAVAKSEFVHRNTNGDIPEPATMAAAWKVAASTISRGKKRAQQ